MPIALIEAAVKKPIFGCHMCGQCVRPDGHCEVKPEMRCVWLKAVERSRRLPWAGEIHDVRPPVDNRLEGTSSWVNLATGRDKQTPKGWHVAA
jgi:methylene-tetrahydrofolate reductase-like protein